MYWNLENYSFNLYFGSTFTVFCKVIIVIKTIILLKACQLCYFYKKKCVIYDTASLFTIQVKFLLFNKD